MCAGTQDAGWEAATVLSSSIQGMEGREGPQGIQG